MVDIRLEQTTCWCGTPFSLPAELLNAARNGGHTIYCPHGHSVGWKETEADRLRRERDKLKQNQAYLEDRLAAEQAHVEKAEGTIKRLKKRMSAGTCPCCQRTFSNMSEHMKRQHPQFVADGGTKVIPIKKRTATP